MGDKWSVYESNVQAYRSNMIASQSFLLAIGAIVIDKLILECACVGIALIQLWIIWYRIIRSRTIICDFYKYDLGSKFNNCGQEINEGCTDFLDEDTYVKDRILRKKVNEKLANMTNKPKLKYNMRLTRFKIDLILPISFSILWILFLLYSLNWI